MKERKTLNYRIEHAIEMLLELGEPYEDDVWDIITEFDNGETGYAAADFHIKLYPLLTNSKASKFENDVAKYVAYIFENYSLITGEPYAEFPSA